MPPLFKLQANGVGSLNSRGTAFGDGSLNTTYRNVSFCSHHRAAGTHHTFYTASHSVRPRNPWRPPRGLGCGVTMDRSQGYTRNFLRRVACFLTACALFNDPSRNVGLTGAFLLATTTARSSNALLGWNCAYAFNSNVSNIFSSRIFF